jgi:hypothetical protein
MGWTETTYSEIRVSTELPPLIDWETYTGASNSVTLGSVNLSVSTTTQNSSMTGGREVSTDLSVSIGNPISPNLSVDQNSRISFGVSADVENGHVAASSSMNLNINGQLTLSAGGVLTFRPIQLARAGSGLPLI